MKIQMCVLANIKQCAYALNIGISFICMILIYQDGRGSEWRVGKLWLVCKVNE